MYVYNSHTCIYYYYLFESHSVVSDSLWPHGLQPTRLLCPWNSTGQITGVCSHSLLQGIFPTQGSNPGLPHCRQILNHVSHRGRPHASMLICINDSDVLRRMWDDSGQKFLSSLKVWILTSCSLGITPHWWFFKAGLLETQDKKQNPPPSPKLGPKWTNSVGSILLIPHRPPCCFYSCSVRYGCSNIQYYRDLLMRDKLHFTGRMSNRP